MIRFARRPCTTESLHEFRIHISLAWDVAFSGVLLSLGVITSAELPRRVDYDCDLSGRRARDILNSANRRVHLAVPPTNGCSVRSRLGCARGANGVQYRFAVFALISILIVFFVLLLAKLNLPSLVSTIC